MNLQGIESENCSGALSQYAALARTKLRETLDVYGLDLEALQLDRLGSVIDILNRFNDLVNTAVNASPLTFDSGVEENQIKTEGNITIAGRLLNSAKIAGKTVIGDDSNLTNFFDGTQNGEFFGYGPEGIPNLEDNVFTKKQSAGNNCQSSKYAATIDSVIQNSANLLATTREQFLGEAQTVFSALAKSDDTFLDGLFVQGVSLLTTYYDLEVEILKLIEDLIEDINEDLVRFEINDVRLEHREIIKRGQQSLTSARFAYQRILNKITQGRGFSEVDYDGGKALIKEAEGRFCDSEFEFNLDPKVFVLLGKIQLLGALRSAWLKRQTQRERSGKDIHTFRADLSSPDLSTLITPFIDFIQCRLAFIIADTQSTLDNDLSPIDMLAKEKIWCLGLKMLQVSIDAIEGILETSSDVLDFQFNESVNFTNDFRLRQNTLLSAKLFDENLTDYISRVEKVIKGDPIAVDPAINRGKNVILISSQRRDDLQGQNTLIEEYLGSDAIQALKIAGGATQFLQLLNDTGNVELAEQLRRGNIKALFTADGIAGSLFQQEFAAIKKLGECAEESDASRGLQTQEAADNDTLGTQEILKRTAVFDVSSESHYTAFFDEIPNEAAEEQDRLQLRLSVAEQSLESRRPELGITASDAAVEMTDRISVADTGLLELIHETFFEVPDSTEFGSPVQFLGTVDILPTPLGLPESIVGNELVNDAGETPFWWPPSLQYPLDTSGTAGANGGTSFEAAKAQIKNFARQAIITRGKTQLTLLQCFNATEQQIAQIGVLANQIIQF